MYVAALALALVTGTMAAAAPAHPPTLRLAAPGLSTSDLDEKKAQFLNGYFAEQVSRRSEQRITVLTGDDVRELVGVERQKALLGCPEDASECVADVAGALKVDGIILGSVARFGSQYAIVVRVVSSPDGAVVWSSSERGLSEEGLVEWLANASGALVAEVNRTAAEIAAASRSSSSVEGSSTSTPGSGSQSGAVSGATEEATEGLQPGRLTRRRAGDTPIDAVASSGAKRDDNSVWLSLLNAEYARRLRGSTSWVGGRLALYQLGFGRQVTSVSGAWLTARLHPLPPGKAWNYSLVGGAGLALISPLTGSGTGSGRLSSDVFIGVEGGWRALRLSCDLHYAGAVERIYVVPGLSLALSF